eukprot:scaffold913_cov71-Cylindrotheca_fusiformis.AAC.5
MVPSDPDYEYARLLRNSRTYPVVRSDPDHAEYTAASLLRSRSRNSASGDGGGSSSSSSSILMDSTTTSDNVVAEADNNAIIPSQQLSSSSSLLSSSSSSFFYMAYRDSGGFFTDITNDEWALMKQRTKEIRQNNSFQMMMMMEDMEPDFACLYERRLGGAGNGATKWILCDPHNVDDVDADCLVYRVGSAARRKEEEEEEFHFEKSIQSEIGNHCEIHTFVLLDPTIDGRPHLAAAAPPPPPGVKYHNWGFRSEQGRNETTSPSSSSHEEVLPATTRTKFFKTMKETVQELGHEGRVIDILRVDYYCDDEGCRDEWTTTTTTTMTYDEGWFNSLFFLLEATTTTFRQILVQIHNPPPPLDDNSRVYKKESVLLFLGLQKHNYVTFHKEYNNNDHVHDCIQEWTTDAAGCSVVEYSFLKLEDSYFAPPK